jgi:hypothetical protein|tara:strand:+ start:19976 stop:20386 length:411 start_codon:yes stop_codon:yes gene_type:complete
MLKIDQGLNKSEEVANFLLFMLEEDRVPVPRLSIGQILLAKARPGLNSQLLASSIVSRFNEAGIPTGVLADGTPNVFEAFVKVMCEEVVDHIQDQMRVDVVLDPGALLNANGANAGGPVVVVGATIAPHTGIGVAR